MHLSVNDKLYDHCFMHTEIIESSLIINDRKFVALLCSLLISEWLTDIREFSPYNQVTVVGDLPIFLVLQ
jgi:hypothetical protein